MPDHTKKPARGKRKSLPGKKPGFDPKQSRLPKGVGPQRGGKGGKPMLFPGRTGGR